MMLLLPEATGIEISIVTVIQVRLILLLEIAPDGFPALRIQRRILIDNILELIHHGSVRNEHHGIFKMHLDITGRVTSEEAVNPGFRKEFHRHGMGLCRLHGDIRMFTNRIISGEVSLEGMATLMGDHICIIRSSIEVGENEGRSVVRDISHISAGCLILPALYIEEFILTHKIHEFTGLRRQLSIEFPAGCEYLLVVTDWHGIPLIEVNSFIKIHQMVYAQALSSSLMQFFHKGNKILLHLPAEGSNLLCSIGITHHSGIT